MRVKLVVESCFIEAAEHEQQRVRNLQRCRLLGGLVPNLGGSQAARQRRGAAEHALH